MILTTDAGCGQGCYGCGCDCGGCDNNDLFYNNCIVADGNKAAAAAAPGNVVVLRHGRMMTIFRQALGFKKNTPKIARAAQ